MALATTEPHEMQEQAQVQHIADVILKKEATAPDNRDDEQLMRPLGKPGSRISLYTKMRDRNRLHQTYTEEETVMSRPIAHAVDVNGVKMWVRHPAPATEISTEKGEN